MYSYVLVCVPLFPTAMAEVRHLEGVGVAARQRLMLPGGCVAPAGRQLQRRLEGPLRALEPSQPQSRECSPHCCLLSFGMNEGVIDICIVK